MPDRHPRARWGAGLVLLPALACTPAPNLARAEEEGALAEVVVTAQRRTQSAEDVGIAITAVDGDELSGRRIQQPLDLAALAPGLATMNATTDSTPLFLIRGVGLDDFNMNNSSGVGMYLDEVFASFPGFLTGSLFDLERVEILEGPQATLYGKNTAGGAINVISRKPTDQLEGYVDLSYSRWATTDLSAAVSGPLNDRIRARLAGTATVQGRGYQTDIDTGARYGRLNRGGLRSLFDVRLTDAASLLLNLHYAYDHSAPSSPSTPNVEAQVSRTPFPIAGRLDSPPGGTLVRVGGLSLFKDELSDGATATLKVRLDGMTLTSISNFDEFFDHSLDNYDGYPAADNNWTKNFQQQQWSEELRLAAAAADRVDWIIGAEYSRNWFHCRDAIDWTFVYGLAGSITDAGKAITATHFIQTQRSTGLYMNAETHLSARWSLITGVRYSHEAASFAGRTLDPTGLLSSAANGLVGPVVPNTVLAALDDSHSSRDVSYRLEPEYRLSEKVLVYASVATAYKAGTYYGQPAQVSVDWGFVRPEHVRSVELGVKGRYLHDMLEWDAAAFESQIRDRQSSLSLWAGPTGTQPLIAGLGNLPRARIDGMESNLEWRPFSGLEVRVAASYLHARVAETLSNDNGLALYTPVAVGQRLPDAPMLSGNWLVTYAHPVGFGLDGYLEADERYLGAMHPYLGDPNIFGNGHSLGARVALRSRVDRWTASIWGMNLTDARPLTYAYAGSEAQRVSYYQRPRALGIEFRKEF